MIVQRHSPYGAAHQPTPTKIVIHAMSEYVLADEGEDYDFAPDFLENAGLSAHVLAAPDGTLYRCRADQEGAYHARGFNVGTLGLEVMVRGRHDYGSFLRAIKRDYVTEAQYASIVQQCREWMSLHGIREVVRHSDLSPGRKLDPGAGFPWERLLGDLK